MQHQRWRCIASSCVEKSEEFACHKCSNETTHGLNSLTPMCTHGIHWLGAPPAALQTRGGSNLSECKNPHLIEDVGNSKDHLRSFCILEVR